MNFKSLGTTLAMTLIVLPAYSDTGDLCWSEKKAQASQVCTGPATHQSPARFCVGSVSESSIDCFFQQPLVETSIVDSKGLHKDVSHLSHFFPSKLKEFEQFEIRDFGIAWNRAMRTSKKVVVPFSISVRWSGKGPFRKLTQGTLHSKGTLVLRSLSNGMVGPDPETLHLSEVTDSQLLEKMARSLFFTTSVFGSHTREQETLKLVNRVVNVVLLDRIAKNPKIMTSPSEAPAFIQVQMPRIRPQQITGL